MTAAAVAAERATGDSWARLVRERRARADRRRRHGDRLPDFVDGRRHGDAAPRWWTGRWCRRTRRTRRSFAPSLGVSSSLSELVTFARLQLNGGAVGGVRVAPAGALAQTLRPTTARTPGRPDRRRPVSGWVLSSFDGRLVASAEGGLASGSSAVVDLVPDDGVAVIVLANAYPEGAALGRALGEDARRPRRARRRPGRLAGASSRPPSRPVLRPAGRERRRRSVTEPAASSCRREPPAGAPAPRPRRAYAGVYENRYYGRVTVRPGPGDGLSVRLGRGETLRYVPWSADIWRDTASGTAAVFDVRGGRARAVKLTLLSFDGRSGAFARAD